MTTKQQINDLHKQFQTYGQNAKEWMRKCQLMLPEIQEKEVWRKKGFTSIYEYAAKLAGMSTHAVDDALWIMKKLEGRLHLKKVVKEKGLNAVRPVLTITTEETEKFWASKAAKLGNNALRKYVEEVKADPGVLGESCDITSQNSENRITKSIYMKLDVKTIERLKKIKGEKEWDELLNTMLDVMESSDVGADDVNSQKEAVEPEENPIPINTGKRYIPAKIRKHVIKKTSGLCAYPGCAKSHDILHHTKRFALDPTHDPDTLAPLCKAHERLAHAGLIKNEEMAPVNWTLKKTPDTDSAKHKIDGKVQEFY
ncbi:hypothetical protein HOG48_05575 [Candidatus Peregrinibacteria bacterium]|jgi:hypothetical protein|nr:hypothetical protein [Candidatus Peregrinibacteria bacterium]